jgi:1-acyl-sn-glycerol-3-phosphate acyltransferase
MYPLAHDTASLPLICCPGDDASAKASVDNREEYSMMLQAQLEEANRLTGQALGNRAIVALAQANEAAGWWLKEQLPAVRERGLNRLGHSLLALHAQLLLERDIQWRVPLPQGPKILAANHPTTTDPFYILTLVREQVSVLVTEGAFQVPGFGRYLRLAGHVPAIRNSSGATVRALSRLVTGGRSVAIFPEGALSPLEGGYHQPHTGAARLALITGAPVVPVGIGLLRDRIRITKTEVDGEVAHLYLRGPYAMTVGRALRFEGDATDHAYVRAVSNQIMQRIIHLAHESEQRVQSPRAAEPRSLPSPLGWANGSLRPHTPR